MTKKPTEIQDYEFVDKQLSRFVFDVNNLNLKDLKKRYKNINLNETSLIKIRYGRYYSENISAIEKIKPKK